MKEQKLKNLQFILFTYLFHKLFKKKTFDMCIRKA